MVHRAKRFCVVDIFDEVDEDLRAERAERLAKKYGWVVIVAAVAVVAGATAWQFYLRWQASRDAAVATSYMAALQAIQAAPSLNTDVQTAQIAPRDAIASSAPDGDRTLARLRAAGLAADAGQTAQALARYNAVAADPKADTLLRDLASLLAAMRDLDQGDPAVLTARLEALAVPPNPWAPLAIEQLASLDLRLGKTEAAKARLKSLAADVTAPAGVRARANALLTSLD